MELTSKIKFAKTLQSLIDIQRDCEISSQRTEDLKDAVDNMNLLVPVVGEFSAGKSSLLNKFIGKNLLSVGIAPETAVPAELYYSEIEYNKGVLPDGRIEEITDISSATSKYSAQPFTTVFAGPACSVVSLLGLPSVPTP
jgi:predicted GTPase